MDRRRRVYHDSGPTSVRSDEMKGAIKMRASFLVNRDPIDSCFGEHRNKFVRMFDHQVTVERNPRYSPERGNNRRPNREIGDEVAIHYVNVENGRSTLDGSLSFFAEAREISRENRSGALDHTNAPVYGVLTRDLGVIHFRPRDFLDHAIRDSFRAYSADRPGVSRALHYGQPRNASVEHRRARHYC